MSNTQKTQRPANAYDLAAIEGGTSDVSVVESIDTWRRRRGLCPVSDQNLSGEALELLSLLGTLLAMPSTPDRALICAVQKAVAGYAEQHLFRR